MFEKFTDKARKVMSLATEEARAQGKMYVGTEHLLLALIKEGEGVAAQALSKLDVTYDEVIATIKEISTDEAEPPSGGHIPYTPRAKRVLEDAYREMMARGQSYIATEHLLLGVVAEGDGRAMTALGRMGVSGDAVRNAVDELLEKDGTNDTSHVGSDVGFGPQFMGAGMPGQSSGPGEGSMLEQFGRNLTKLAADGKLDPVIGRDREVERVMQVLARRQKNNPLILGDPGVGKTAIVEGLAQLVAGGNVPDILRSKQLWTLDIASLVAGSKPSSAPAPPRAPSTPPRSSSRRCPAARSRSSAPPPPRSTASTSRRTPPSRGASSRSTSASPPPRTPSRSSTACRPPTRRTTTCATPRRPSQPRSRSRTATCRTASCPTRRST